jgi:hypothetical protein
MELKRSLIRELTVRLHSRLMEDLRPVFYGKGDLPPASDIYEILQVYSNDKPLY